FFKVMWNDLWKLKDGDRILGVPEEMAAQDAEAENKMCKMGLEIEVQPMDDDQEHMQIHDKFLGEEKNELIKTLMMTHILEHKKSDEQKQIIKQQMQQQQMMQQQMMQQQGSKPGSGNRTQLSPNSSTGAQASGIRA